MTAPALPLCLALDAAQARITQALDEALGAWHGLAWPDLALLLRLQQAPGGEATLAQAAAWHGLAPSALLRRVLPMQKVGWVERRGARLCLRPAGERLAREAAVTAELAAHQRLGALDAAQQRALQGALLALAPGAPAVPLDARAP